MSEPKMITINVWCDGSDATAVDAPDSTWIDVAGELNVPDGSVYAVRSSPHDAATTVVTFVGPYQTQWTGQYMDITKIIGPTE